MKKLVLILVAFVGLHASSLASNQSPQTQLDSLSYSLGFDIGRSIFEQVDSTLNTAIICDGIVAAFSNDTSFINKESARQFIQTYMTVTKPRINDKLSKEYLAKMEREAGVMKSESGLLYKIEFEGDGDKPAVGDTMVIDYTFYDATGKKVQSSSDSGHPLDMVNTDGSLIAGFLEGVRMLGKGGKATLYIPSELGYGEGGPFPKMALTFEVEIVDIKKPIEEVVEVGKVEKRLLKR